MLQVVRSWVRFRMESLDFSFDLNPSTIVPGSTQPLTKMSTRNLPGGANDGRLIRLTTSPSYVSRLSRKMWEPLSLIILWDFTVCYRDSFIFSRFRNLLLQRYRETTYIVENQKFSSLLLYIFTTFKNIVTLLHFPLNGNG
jgi:hypothetical protein